MSIIQANKNFSKMNFSALILIVILSLWCQADCHPVHQEGELSNGNHVKPSSQDPEETVGNYDHGRGSQVASRDRTADYRCANGQPVEKCPPHLRLIVDPPFAEDN